MASVNVKKVDCLVLGGGIVGVSAALQLQLRGRQTVLVDRRGAVGLETSFGNAGLIERASVFPYSFPRDLTLVLKTAFNLGNDARYHLSALPVILPWLISYWQHSSPEAIAKTAKGALPLITHCLSEHETLMGMANATQLLRKTGWIKLFRSEKKRDNGFKDAARLAPYGLTAQCLNAQELAVLEPHLSGALGAVHYKDPGFISDPAALTQTYADLFVAKGGLFVQGDAKTLTQSTNGWQVSTQDGPVIARDAILALGPWADDVFRPLGYRLPFAVKRGYHKHFAPKGNAVLTHPVLDTEDGYLLAPMQRGIRMTTGAEFARRNAPPTPVQVARAEPAARALFPLGDALDATPWMGCRPCFPDMLPVIGKAPRHEGLWFNFGHQHHGLTLGPISGRLLADMVTGAQPFTDPSPYAIERFG